MNKNIKASSWYLVGNLFDKAIAFLTIPIFTRMLTTTDYGIVNTYMSYVVILAIILGLSMESSIQTAYFEFRNDIKSYISTIIIVSLFFTLIFTMAIVSGIWILEIKVSFFLVFLTILQGFMMYVLNVAKMYYMMQVKYIQRVILMSGPHTLMAFFSVWGIMLCTTEKYMGMIIPYATVVSIFGISVLIYFWKKTGCCLKKIYFKYAITYSLPIVFHALSLQVLSQFDKIMLTSLRNAAETGIYSLIYNVGLVSQVFTNAFDNAWLPWFQKKLREDNKYEIINKNVVYLMFIVSVIIIEITIISPEVIKILSPEEYWYGIPMVIPIILATYVMFLYTLEVHTEYAYKKTKQIPVYTAIAAIIKLLLNYMIIPIYGAMASANITLLTYIILFIMHYRAARKCNNKILPIKVFFLPTIIVLGALVILWIFLNDWLIRWALGLMFGMVFVVYILKKNILKKMLSD
ncbi:oligosaccharide flippase family protein [Megamonas hypermegale]|uniref:oligosaccharide flippase family protein n=1 Tax=Megamonas hypermegale TaxID=158847 RepID=UPI0026ECC730|nr:oligosaccharide flippase family protein [Megamonas hypermegale]